MAASETLSRLLYEGAALDPAATAVEDDGEKISYAELMRRVESMGSALQHCVPGRGGRIAICAANHADHLAAYLAILVSGFVWVPLNPANGHALNTAIVQKARPDLVLVDRASVEQAPETDRLLQLDELHNEAGEFETTKAAAADIAAIKFTGGTTGEPKGVVQTHGNMLAVIENMQSFYEFSHKDCNLAIAPLTHGSSHFMLPILAAGGRHRFLHDRAPASIIAAMRDDTTIAFMPPTLIYKLLQSNGLSPDQFGNLRHLTYSAAPMSPERILEAQEAFGPRISTLYGQTEAPMTICALNTEEMLDPALRCTVGKPCYSSHVRIVDDTGGEVTPGVVGNIEMQGPIVMQGYLDEPGLTDATLRDGWLCTGDLGALDDPGYLTLSGRASEVIITGGFNVYPAEIENVLAHAPGVRECCVYSVVDKYWGERIEAAVVYEPNASETGVLGFVKNALGPVRTPKALHKVDALPRNAVGKVVRRDIAAFIQSLQEQDDVRSI